MSTKNKSQIIPLRTERDTLERLVYDSIPTLRILRAPSKVRLPQGESISCEIRWLAVKDSIETIQQNLRTKDYLLPDAERILLDDLWIGLKPLGEEDRWILTLVLIAHAVVPQVVGGKGAVAQPK